MQVNNKVSDEDKAHENIESEIDEKIYIRLII